jgi:two-component system nitrogen regulation response regulator NtrX
MYDWPGNIRQLKNLVEWLFIMCSKSKAEVTANELPQEINSNKTTSKEGLLYNEIMLKPLRDARNVFEKEYLQSQLNRFSGNISKTAEQVGMERTALHRKLRTLKIVE